jgi:hypothetical protein
LPERKMVPREGKGFEDPAGGRADGTVVVLVLRAGGLRWLMAGRAENRTQKRHAAERRVIVAPKQIRKDYMLTKRSQH